jgi:hypothetical protein
MILVKLAIFNSLSAFFANKIRPESRSINIAACAEPANGGVAYTYIGTSSITKITTKKCHRFTGFTSPSNRVCTRICGQGKRIDQKQGKDREFSPKGMDLAKVSQQDVDYAIYLINHRPRKCLGWKSTHDSFLDELAHLA